MNSRPFPLALVLLLICAQAAFAQQQTSNDTFANDPTARVFELVLPADHLLGDWGGLRSRLEESGVTPRLTLVTDVAGNPIGGLSQGATAPSSVELSLFFDLDKTSGLKGGSVFMSSSERWGESLSKEYILPVSDRSELQTFSGSMRQFGHTPSLKVLRFLELQTLSQARCAR